MIAFNPANLNDWQQVWTLSNIPLSTPPNRYSRVMCPVLLTSPILAVMFSVPFQVEKPLIFGGWISRYVQTGLIVGGQPDARLEGAKKLWANHLQLLYFNVKTSYSLVFDASVKGDGCNLFVWEYVGAIT